MTSWSSSDINISVPGFIKAKAQRIHRLNGKVRRVFWDLDHCLDIAKRWDSLTPVQKIQLERYATDKLLELLELYNRHVLHSIRYRLREKTSEEEEQGQQQEEMK